MNFASDNVTGAAPEIMAALEVANDGATMPYGNDDLTRRVEARIADVFETDAAVFLVATGTAANALALSALTPPFGAVYCHWQSHVYEDECGAPELFSGGAKLVPVGGDHAKLDIAELEQRLFEAGNVHHPQPTCVSLTQESELGAVYGLDEVAAVSELCRRHGLKLHMDGARFANAVAALGCSPAEASRKVGVDALSFGATKNGALAAEAVVFFEPELARDFAYRRKRGGHLFSKMRFLAAQWDAYLTDDLWLKHAGHANAMAGRLADGLAAVPGVELAHPVEANELFPVLPGAVIDGLKRDGFTFYERGGGLARMVCAFNTRQEDVDALIASARRHAGAAAAE